MINCGNCNSPVSDKYCSNCGRPATLKRIDGHYIIHEINHVLHFEKGILFTIRELLLRPGKNVRHFILENRNRLVKPIIFIIVTSLTFTVIIHFFQIENGYVNFEGTKKSTTSTIFNWIQGHYGYSNLIMGVFIAFWTKIFFKNFPYNFFEILILLCFVMGMEMLFFSVFAILQGITHFDLMQIAAVVGLLYCIWAIGQFFEKKKVINYVKAFAAYMLGMITFSLSVILIATLIDLIIKK